MAGASAEAATITATGETGAVLTRSTNPKTGTTTYGPEDTDAIWASGKKGGSFEGVISVTESHVTFENGVAVSGGFSSATSTSSVDVTVTNNGAKVLSIAEFGSTIIPAGLGFFVQDRSGGVAQDNNIFTGYGEVAKYDDAGNLLKPPVTFSSFVTSVGKGAANPFAYADFEFNITSPNAEGALYHLDGSLSLYFDDNGKLQQGYNLSDASMALLGFRAVDGVYGSATVDAYKWDATDIVVPLNALLNPGESTLINYSTRVSAYTRTDCADRSSFYCIVAYAGFGDPVGRGGAVEESFARGFIGIDSECDKSNRGGAVDHIEFCPVEYDPVRLLASNGGGVPEPTSWALLIGGFGAIGGTLRRRRGLVARA